MRGRDELRFGLPGATAAEKQLADGDTALLLKHMGLWILAKEHTEFGKPDPLFVTESPQDPWDYMPEASRQEFPSFWNFEEVQQVRNEFNMQLTTFDQGALGHARRKPTGVLSNFPRMTVLQGHTGASAEPIEEELEARLKQSSRWASWAPGLVRVIREAMKEHCEAWDEAGSSLGGAACPQVKGLTLEQWKQHIKRGHIPFNNRCRTCLKEMGVDLPHRRQKDGGTAFIMSADVV